MRTKCSLFFLGLIVAIACRGQEKAILSNNPRIHYMGRIIMKDSVTELSWTATTVSIRFNGSGIKALLRDERGKHADDWGAVELIKLVRKLQPGIIVNNRLGLDEYADGGDFVTPEQVSCQGGQPDPERRTHCPRRI